jgi:hypothetical protein
MAARAAGRSAQVFWLRAIQADRLTIRSSRPGWLAGETDKARRQYEAARATAQDWHDNKYGVDVGKQAWLDGVLDYVREQLKEK